MIKAVIFDMDGVISDTDTPRTEFIEKLLNEKGIVPSCKTLTRFSGIRTKDLLYKFFGDQLTDVDIEEIVNKKHKIIKEHPEDMIRAYPKVKEVLETLHKKGIRIAVASATESDAIEFVLETLNIRNYFEVISGTDQVEHSKPAPDLYLLVLKKLELNPDECIVVEDSPVGIKAGKSAGLNVIAIPNTYPKEDLAEADHIINSIDELLDSLKV